MNSSKSKTLDQLASEGVDAGTIPVHISFEIIRLFSEGLYQSPHKAIEELVSNGYDAQATAVHVLMPQPVGDHADMHAAVEQAGAGQDSTEAIPEGATPAAETITAPLWVIDNGNGMNSEEFFQLWRVAYSPKATVVPVEGQRPPIGQFGIGKLAAYVLAWRLTHISRSGDEIHLTSMNFRDLEGRHQEDSTSAFTLGLRRIDESAAKPILADVEARDPQAWAFMFGPHAAPTWTAAALSDFKALYDRLSGGRLGWVLRTGLPLHTNFQIWLNGKELKSSKSGGKIVTTEGPPVPWTLEHR